MLPFNIFEVYFATIIAFVKIILKGQFPLRFFRVMESFIVDQYLIFFYLQFLYYCKFLVWHFMSFATIACKYN